MQKDLLTIQEITLSDLQKIFELASAMKQNRGKGGERPLKDKSVAMIFSKSSTRTRVSFEVGIQELGGNVVYMEQSQMQLGRGETIADTARVLSRYLHAIVIRTYKHADVVELAKHAHIPVINALTDDFHPCQVVSDLFTMYEVSDTLKGTKLTFLGDGTSNMANSLILGCKLSGVNLHISSPADYKPKLDLVESIAGTGTLTWSEDPVEAVKDADFVYTDVWVSMGCEKEAAKRLEDLQKYQLNKTLLNHASPGAKVLHCLPAHRGQEITDEVLDSHQSIVLDEAENRLHVQKAIMALLIGNATN